MKVNIIRFWPIPVLLFFVYGLYTLVADSYEVLYLKGNETDQLQLLACVDLSRICPNKTEIDLKELRHDLINHFNSSAAYRHERRAYRRQIELIFTRTKSGDYLVLNREICLIAKDQKELVDFENVVPRDRKLLTIRSDTFDFVQMKSPSVKIDQLIVLKKGRPYSDCGQSNGRFFCLNECLRSRFRLARYFYYANETGTILLHFNESNRTIQENERSCFRQCRRENCKLVKLMPVYSKGYIIPKIETIQAEPVVSAFDFWLEIVGLIFSLVGLFFDQFATIVTKLARSRVRRRKVKVGLFYLNLAIILLSLAYCGYLCVRVALDQQEDANDLPEKTRNLIHPKTVHLAICVGIETYVKKFKVKMTMSEIERATNTALDDVLESIYLRDGGRSFRIDYLVDHRKILFKILLQDSQAKQLFLRRCFSLLIYPNYQTIPSRPKLTVRLKPKLRKNHFFELYVLSEEENLNSKSFKYDGSFAFEKRIVKRLKGRCVDYKAMYGNCTGRQNCVERCIGKNLMEKFNRIPFGPVNKYQMIDRDWFSLSEWNTTKPIDPDRSILLNVSRECEMMPEKACHETMFKPTVEIKKPDSLTMEIDLQFDVMWFVEEMPSSLRMALDLLGIQSIFFVFTLLQLFWLLYQFTKPRWRLKKKTDKVVWFLICLFASIGCSWNTVRMLDVIVNGELMPTEHYELAERVQMPAMVFCLRIDQKLVDRNHQLTGNYLEVVTKQMNVSNIFKSILYLNESNEWIPCDLPRVERFFFLDMKCLRVHIEGYNRNQFHFSWDTQVLRVNFDRIKQNRFVHFMTQSRETAEFSKISNLDYLRQRYQITHESFLYEHEDHFGFFRRHFPPLQEGDVGDLRGQLLELQGIEPTRRTLSLPVEEEHFGLEVDEDYFEQLYSTQKKNPNKRTNLNYRQMFVTNHLKKEDKFVKFDFDFSFHLVFLRRVVHSTNEVNLATLTLALLNLLTLWLELGVLDLRPFLVHLHDHFLVYLYLHLPSLLLRRLIKALIFCCRLLKKLEPQFYDRIDPRPTLLQAQTKRARSAPVSRSSPRPPHRSLSAFARPQVHQSPSLPLQVSKETRTNALRPPDDSSTSDQPPASSDT